MNIENLLINRVVRGTLFNRLTNEVIFRLDEISNPTLECGGEHVYTTDAFKVGDKVAIWYDAEVEKDAQIIRNTTKDFAKSGKFVLEVLVAEPCAPEVEYYAYIIFNSAKLDNNVSLNLTTEANHPFSITALRDYCSDYDELFSIIVAA